MVVTTTKHKTPPHPHTIRICASDGISTGKEEQPLRRQEQKKRASPASRRPPPLDVRRISEYRRGAPPESTPAAPRIIQAKEARCEGGAVLRPSCRCIWGTWRLIRSPQSVIGLHNLSRLSKKVPTKRYRSHPGIINIGSVCGAGCLKHSYNELDCLPDGAASEFFIPEPQ